MVTYVTTILVAVANISLHLVFKDLRTMVGVLVMILCGFVAINTVLLITSLTYSYTNNGSENTVVCAVFASVLYFLITVYQGLKLVIQFQFAYYLMYKSLKLRSQDTIDKRRLMIKFLIFCLVSSVFCYLAAVLIDLAVTGKFYGNFTLTMFLYFELYPLQNLLHSLQWS